MHRLEMAELIQQFRRRGRSTAKLHDNLEILTFVVMNGLLGVQQHARTTTCVSCVDDSPSLYINTVSFWEWCSHVFRSLSPTTGYRRSNQPPLLFLTTLSLSPSPIASLPHLSRLSSLLISPQFSTSLFSFVYHSWEMEGKTPLGIVIPLES